MGVSLLKMLVMFILLAVPFYVMKAFRLSGCFVPPTVNLGAKMEVSGKRHALAALLLGKNTSAH